MTNRSVLNVGKRPLIAKSCTHCLELKPESEFRKARGYYQGECRICQHKSGKRADARANSRSLETAGRLRTEWTDSDVEMLSRMTEEGKPRAEIAKAIGRSVSSVDNAKIRYGITQSQRR